MSEYESTHKLACLCYTVCDFGTRKNLALSLQRAEKKDSFYATAGYIEEHCCRSLRRVPENGAPPSQRATITGVGAPCRLDTDDLFARRDGGDRARLRSVSFDLRRSAPGRCRVDATGPPAVSHIGAHAHRNQEDLP